MKTFLFIIIFAITNISILSQSFKENYRIMILPGKDAKSEALRDELTTSILSGGSPKIQIIGLVYYCLILQFVKFLLWHHFI